MDSDIVGHPSTLDSSNVGHPSTMDSNKQAYLLHCSDCELQSIYVLYSIFMFYCNFKYSNLLFYPLQK